ncbi:MAG: nucleotide exchange factor GrpE [Thaumarchaeota archaeon]|nr:nucleotide exchange factor GrpE [Nitrososphaerota archaeon]
MSEDKMNGTEGETAEERLVREQERNQILLTRLKYAQADLENYRKRAEKEMVDAAEASVRGLAAKLLSVLDGLELAVKHAEEEGASRELKEGIQMVDRNLAAALESAGMEKIECVGKPFDPSMHEAVEKVQGKAGLDTVVEEVRPGFTFRGRVVRPSMVKVELGLGPQQEAKADE